MMLSTAIIGGISIAVTAYVFGQLTDRERKRQERAREEYNKYAATQKKQLKNIDKYRNERKGQLTDEYRNALRELHNSAIQRQEQVKREYYEELSDLVKERQSHSLNLRGELNEAINRIFQLQRSQITQLRDNSLELLKKELLTAANKNMAYAYYLKAYKKNLDIKFEKREHELPEPVNFRLPDKFPYNGKLYYFKKKDLQEEKLEMKLAENLYHPGKFYIRDFKFLEEFGEEALIPLLVEKYDPDEYHYILSFSKGLFMNNVINQPGVGIEAEVVKLGKNKCFLKFYDLELRLDKRNFINPRRNPILESKKTVFPYRWAYGLKKPPKVTEKYQESYTLQNFGTIPMILDEKELEQLKRKIANMPDNLATGEWKIAPLFEEDIPQISDLKLQLEDDMLIHGKIEQGEDNKSYIRFVKFLDDDSLCKPEDIFVAIDANIGVCLLDDITELSKTILNTMNDLSIFLHSEFKLQKQIKDSQGGITYYNKWADITEKLINYLYKDTKNAFICDVIDISYECMDRKSGLARYSAFIDNSEEINEYFQKREGKYYQYEFFTIDNDGQNIIVEFTETLEKIYLYAESIRFNESEKTILTIWPKTYPYPEIQQKIALNKFRCGQLINPKLKSYLLDSKNIKKRIRYNMRISDFFNIDIKNNIYQKDSLEGAFRENDFYMIQGPPGTGKTTVIKELIMQELKNNPQHNILITSQANVAVDNVLEGLYKDYGNENKILDLNNCIRCGNEGSIDNRIMFMSFTKKYAKYTEKVKNLDSSDIAKNKNNKKYIEKWQKYVLYTDGVESEIGELILKSHKIIGATCVGLAKRKLGLDQMEFDLTIIDEASKALPGELLIPLIRSKKVVIIGDHKQLPPVINPVLRSKKEIEIKDREYCQNEMFDISLFQRLYEDCPPSNKSMLRTQFRMPEVIGNMISELFYQSRLENGNNTYDKLPLYHHTNSLNFLNMDKVKVYQEYTEKGRSPYNSIEVEIVYKLIKNIRNKISKENRIAVITPYRGQKRKIQSYLKNNNIDLYSHNIAVDTVDAFQGDEAEIVIFCTTRALKPTSFFGDNARLNVAFSRTVNELIIIGSLKYFYKYRKDSAMYKIGEYIKKNGQIHRYQDK